MSDIRYNGWLHTTGTGGVYQDSAGNVGIASTQPQTTLDIGKGEFQVGPAGIATVTTVNATNLINSSQLSHRNLVINGAMKVAQRGTSFTATGDEYTIDRWRHSHGSSFNFDTTTTQESSGPDGFTKSLKITPDSVVTPSGGENGIIEHYIEGQNVQGLAFGTSSAKNITISFYAKSAATNANDQYTMWVQIYDTAGPNNRFIQNKAFTVTASWQRFSLTFTGSTSNAIINSNTLGIRLGWILASGPDDIASAKTSWEDSNFWRAVTGQSNFMDNTSNEFHLTGVQVEEGSVATPFEHRTYADELQHCKRYYQRLTKYNQQPYAAGYFESDTIGRHCIQLPVSMRTAPTATFSTASTFTNIYTGALSAGTSISTINTDEDTIFTSLTVGAGGGTDGQACLLGAASSATSEIYLDAEM